VTLMSPLIDEEAAQDVARQLEAKHPWIVLYGTYTRQFVCFPKFEAPSGTMLVATYPGVLPDRMRRAEEAISRRVSNDNAMAGTDSMNAPKRTQVTTG
jgi:hypothetical protein